MALIFFMFGFRLKNWPMKIQIILWLGVLVMLNACGSDSPTADVILLNANVYTVDEENPQAEAIAIQDGRILAVGAASDVEAFRAAETETMDMEGRFVMPGFIEGHGHFSGLGSSLMNLNFLQSRSWDEIVAAVAEKAGETSAGDWIVGRGWHQEKWTASPQPNVLGYPYHDGLSALTPDHPVVLRHASGHALFANARAMQLAGITRETPDPSGGEIVRDARGRATGVFEETAMALINQAYRAYRDSMTAEAREAEWLRGIELAQQECLAKGITSFQDAGSSFEEVLRYQELAENGAFDLRLWAMIRESSEELSGKVDALPILDAGDHFFTCRAFKVSIDGALGSFGAWLLEPYEDKPDFIGQNTTPVPEVENLARLARDNGIQMCVHAIGDRANRVVLDIYEQMIGDNPTQQNLRWRIEHAQHLHPDDIGRFARLGVIPAMQAIHCTSDAPFVVKRLGEERAREGAYPWRSLLDQGALVTNGTDAPVEDVDPIPSFYASVTRRRPDSGLLFFPEQSMTREEAIKSYTLSNAYAAFEEDQKGSIEVGKLADLVVLSNDLLTCSDEEILETEVHMTMVGGEVKYRK